MVVVSNADGSYFVAGIQGQSLYFKSADQLVEHCISLVTQVEKIESTSSLINQQKPLVSRSDNQPFFSLFRSLR